MTIQQANAQMAFYGEQPFAPHALEAAFAALCGDECAVNFIGVVGAAGKTCVATLEAEILKAAGFRTGRYTLGASPVRARILIDGKPVSAKSYTAAVAALAKCGGALSRDMAEFLVACACFAKEDCAFALLELADGAFAGVLPRMPACAITQIGADGTNASDARLAKLACSALRIGCAVVTSPVQSEAAITEIRLEAVKANCKLTVPELDDFTEKPNRRLQNRMDYGGYEVMLPFLGVHAQHNAAIAIELALAIWRCGYTIEDEAILEGLSIAENADSQLVLRRAPVVLADSCHTPLQAAALCQSLKAMDYEALAAIVAFDTENGLDDFFSALETGEVVDKDNLTKELLPGMSDNPIDKMYAVCLHEESFGVGAVDGAQGVSARDVARCGKFHFDIVPCASLDEAVQRAEADCGDGIVACGSAALVEELKTRFD